LSDHLQQNTRPVLINVRTKRLAMVLGMFMIAFSAGSHAQTEAISILRNVAYGPDKLNSFDVYLPANPQNAPVIFMVHGGGWFRGDKASRGVVAAKVEHWLPLGYIFVSTNYRLMPQTRPLAQAHDVARALAKAQELAQSWGGNPARFTIIGHSSGAHLVALLAADPSIATSRGARFWKNAVIIDSAAMNIPGLMSNAHSRFYDQVFGADRSSWSPASPLHRLKTPGPPIMTICSSLRRWSCWRAREFASAAQKVGTRTIVLPIALNHRQLNTKLGLPGKYSDRVTQFIAGQ
jgi:acetyl esterase/lipase